MTQTTGTSGKSPDDGECNDF